MLAFAAASYAQDVDRPLSAYVTAFGEYTDNIARTFDDEKSALIYGAGVGFDLQTNRRRVRSKLQGDLSYLDSDEDLYESGVLGQVLGNVELSAIPDRLSWLIDGAYGQIPVDERLADTPANRQDFTTIRTGPELTVPLSRRTTLQLGGSYATTNYEIALDDFDRVEGALSLRYRLSPRQTISLTGATTDTRFEREDLFTDYRQDRGFLEWSATGARTTLLVQAGYDVLEEDDQDDNSGSTIYNVRVTRRVGQRGTVVLQVDQQLSDTSSAFARRVEFTGVGGGAVDVSPSAGVFRARSGKLHYRTSARQLQIDVGAMYEEDRYVDDDAFGANDRDLVFSSLAVFKIMSPSVLAGFFGDVTKAEFVQEDFEYTEWDAGLLGAWRILPSLGLQLSAGRSKRSGGLERGGFEENVVRLSLFYATGDAPLSLRDRPGRH